MKVLIHSYAVETLGPLHRGQYPLVIADPPYNLGLKYDGIDDDLDPETYKARVRDWCRAMDLLLTENGSLWVVISEYWSYWYRACLEDLGLHWRNTVIWRYGFGPAQRKKFTPAHASILYYTKHKTDFTFTPDREQSERQRIGDKRANPNGKVPDDVWDFSRVCGTFHERIPGVPTQLPVALVERIITTSSKPGEWVCDPFAGSGTTAVAAVRAGRNCVLSEPSAKYREIAKTRIEAERKGAA